MCFKLFCFDITRAQCGATISWAIWLNGHQSKVVKLDGGQTSLHTASGAAVKLTNHVHLERKMFDLHKCLGALWSWHRQTFVMRLLSVSVWPERFQ